MARTTPKKLKGDKKYVDAPRLKAIYGYEDLFKKQFGNALSLGLSDVKKQIQKQSKPQLLFKAMNTPTFSGWKLQKKYWWQGLQISIENKKGSVRKWETDTDSGKTKMLYDYGYIRRTLGADGDHIDCYVNKDNESEKVFVVHQNDPTTGKYDEDKVMLGFDTAAQAKKAYLAHYDSNKFFGSMIEMTLTELKAQVIGKTTKKIK